MESVPEPRPSEWDKRLTTNSPFRTVNINDQLQPAVSPKPPSRNDNVTIVVVIIIIIISLLSLSCHNKNQLWFR